MLAGAAEVHVKDFDTVGLSGEELSAEVSFEGFDFIAFALGVDFGGIDYVDVSGSEAVACFDHFFTYGDEVNEQVGTVLSKKLVDVSFDEFDQVDVVSAAEAVVGAEHD